MHSNGFISEPDMFYTTRFALLQNAAQTDFSKDFGGGKGGGGFCLNEEMKILLLLFILIAYTVEVFILSLYFMDFLFKIIK